jgi:hypothetical protein|tara:strand:- start:382 stop:705 length:324 start_codon:yes stop_codon:yes gene_type:complete
MLQRVIDPQLVEIALQEQQQPQEQLQGERIALQEQQQPQEQLRGERIALRDLLRLQDQLRDLQIVHRALPPLRDLRRVPIQLQLQDDLVGQQEVVGEVAQQEDVTRY